MLAIPAGSIELRRSGLQDSRADSSADAVLCTWTLCSIPDAEAAVREIRRVLKPGARFHFVEHGRSPQPGVRKWQDRLNGLQGRLGGGCSLNRDIPAIINAGGLTIEQLDTYYAKGDPKTHGWTFEGTATTPTPAPS